MTYQLLNPDNLNPDETHAYDIDMELFDGENWGAIVDRGYTSSMNKPVYAYHCDDNMTRTITESNIVEVNEDV